MSRMLHKIGSDFERPGITPFVLNDGGRAAAGYKGKTGDCVCRAIAIATGLPYKKVYLDLSRLAKGNHAIKGSRSQPSIRKGVNPAVADTYLASLGWRWVPTMHVGEGCTVHLRPDELPSGHLIVKVSRHFVAVIDGVIHDTYDCSREGNRCVYGYYAKDLSLS